MLVGSAPGAHAQRSRVPEVGCASCLVVADDGRTLFARAAEARRPNASTTKLVTALIARRRVGLNELVPISGAAAATGGGTLALEPGESYTVRDLLKAMLLESSNDAAVALAEFISGSEVRFVARMNVYARRHDLADTRFVTAHGLDRPRHHSSARDLAAIAEIVLGDPVLAEIVASRTDVIYGPRGAVRVENRNLLLQSYRGAIGVKTGYTLGAGNVLVAAARRRGRRLIAVAMGSDDSFEDARRLLDHGFARLRRTVLVREGDIVGAVVFDGRATLAVVARRTVRGPYDPDSVTATFVPYDDLVFPVTRGELVGTVNVRAGGRQVASVGGIAGRAVPRPERSWAADILAGLLGVLGRGLEAIV